MSQIHVIKQEALGCGIACLVSVLRDSNPTIDHRQICCGVLKDVLHCGGPLEGAFLPHLLAGFVLSLGIANHFVTGQGRQFIEDSVPFVHDACVILYQSGGHFLRLAGASQSGFAAMCPSRAAIVPIDWSHADEYFVYRCLRTGSFQALPI